MDDKMPSTLSICVDCAYFNEYGRLDDQTMDANPDAAIEHAARIAARWGCDVEFTSGRIYGDGEDIPGETESWFSSSPCDECGSMLAGGREYATVWQ